MYLALGSGLPRFPPDFSCPAVLRYLTSAFDFVYGTVTLFGWPCQTILLAVYALCVALQPQPRGWFRLFRVRSPLLTEYFLFLKLLRCFSSLGSPRFPGTVTLLTVGFPIRTS